MISDFMPVSLNDYPGQIAATVFTSGCNFACPYCHNATLIEFDDKNVDEQFFKYIRDREKLIKAVCITGGEPTLQTGLIDFCRKCKDFDLLVKLDTNGTDPVILKELISEQLIDYIAMDIKTTFDKYSDFGSSENQTPKIKESIKIIKNSDMDYEFRITVHPKLLSEKQAIEIAQEISPVKRLALQAYKYSEGVLDKNFCGQQPCSPEYLARIKTSMEGYIDNIKLRE